MNINDEIVKHFGDANYTIQTFHHNCWQHGKIFVTWPLLQQHYIKRHDQEEITFRTLIASNVNKKAFYFQDNGIDQAMIQSQIISIFLLEIITIMGF